MNLTVNSLLLMLPRKLTSTQLLQKPQMFFGKHGNKAKKAEKKNKYESNAEKENQPGMDNRPIATVDLTKKIKKLSPKKIIKPAPVEKEERIHGVRVFREDELDMDMELRNMIIPQRIDNDVDTDEEQINAGIRKLHRLLLDRLNEGEM